MIRTLNHRRNVYFPSITTAVTLNYIVLPRQEPLLPIVAEMAPSARGHRQHKYVCDTESARE